LQGQSAQIVPEKTTAAERSAMSGNRGRGKPAIAASAIPRMQGLQEIRGSTICIFLGKKVRIECDCTWIADSETIPCHRIHAQPKS
jgi:hypothetical protein